MAINFEHLLILCGEPPGHCRPQRNATQRPQRYNRGKEKTSPRDGFFALTPTMAQDRTEPGPPRATANSGPRHCNWHCGWRLPGLVPTAKEKKHDDMWVYSANCNVYLYIYIAVGTNPRVVIDCKWHKAHCSVMPCHAVPPAADEWACPPAGAWAGASRVKASVHPTAFRPEAIAPPVGVFLQTRAVSPMDATTAIATAAGICLAARTAQADAGATAKHCSISPHIEPAGGFHGNRAHGG